MSKNRIWILYQKKVFAVKRKPMVEMESRNSFQLFKLQPKRDHIYSSDTLKNIQNLQLGATKTAEMPFYEAK